MSVAPLLAAPAADAVIFDEVGHVLLTRRADNGRWCLPCGHMEPGESIVATVVREALEETGLEVAVEKPTGVYIRPHPSCPHKGLQIVAFVFVCRVVGGQLRTSDETSQFGYFDPTRLPPEIVPTHVERIVDAVAVVGGAEFRVS